MDLEIIIDKMREMGLEKIRVKGQNAMCVCPFHPDRSPSFGIHPERGGNCFACGTKFPNTDVALEEIAKKKGLPYTPIYRDIPLDYDFVPEEEVEPEPLNAGVLKFYKEDDEYFIKNWKVSKDVVHRRQLRIDPYSEAECFPIFDTQSNYWGCVERHAATDTHRSYYHYPPGYPRRNILLGEDKAEGRVWIVEGIRDLCAIETKIGDSAVALGGSKPSKEQIYKIRRFDEKVIALDNDKAGRIGRDCLIDAIGNAYVARFNAKDPMDATDFEVKETGISYLDFSAS